MPVVITDFTNKVWAVEQPNDGYLHVGYTGSPGPKLIDALDFIKIRQKQFDGFIRRREEQERKDAAKRRTSRVIVQQREL